MLTAKAIGMLSDRLTGFYMEMAEAVEMLSAKLTEVSVKTAFSSK